MRELLDHIERALEASRLTPSQASLRAVGSKELILEMRRGRVPSVERFKALCEVLDLEFYVGPRRRGPTVDATRLERAIEAADHGLGLTARSLNSADKARFVAAIYDLIGEDDTAERNATRILQLIDAIAEHRGSDERTALAGARQRSPGRGRGAARTTRRR